MAMRHCAAALPHCGQRDRLAQLALRVASPQAATAPSPFPDSRTAHRGTGGPTPLWFRVAHSNGLLAHSAFGSFFGFELSSAVKDNGLGRHPPGQVEATGAVGRETMLGRPPRLSVASQHGMLTWACVLLAQEVFCSRDIVAVTFEAGAP